MTTSNKFFFQNPNTGTPMVLTLGETGTVCLFTEGDAVETEQDAEDLNRWRAAAEGFRGTSGLNAVRVQLKLEGADLS